MPLDVSSDAGWQAALDICDVIDVLVNNAGITTLGSIEEFTLEQFRHEFEVDVVGAFLGCKHGVAKMKARGGAIINMSSMTGVRAQGALADLQRGGTFGGICAALSDSVDPANVAAAAGAMLLNWLELGVVRSARS